MIQFGFLEVHCGRGWRGKGGPHEKQWRPEVLGEGRGQGWICTSGLRAWVGAECLASGWGYHPPTYVMQGKSRFCSKTPWGVPGSHHLQDTCLSALCHPGTASRSYLLYSSFPCSKRTHGARRKPVVDCGWVCGAEVWERPGAWSRRGLELSKP